MPVASAMKVLVVDDQLTMRQLVRNSLQQLSISEVSEAHDGEDGLRKLVQNPANLVITDFNMPNLDGLGLLRAIRAHGPLRSTAVIMLTGRADKRLLRTGEYEEAQRLVRQQPVDLIICEGGPLHSTEGFEGYDFVRWLRRSGLEPNAYAAVMLASAHTGHSGVSRARDCGAHFIIKKPLVPGVLLDRILWIARTNRPFVNCPAYVGPDRRFKNQGSPTGVGRRATDLSTEVGFASTPNMSQDEIDNLMQPQRVAL